jgi:cobalamin biosynthetic protein CobC
MEICAAAGTQAIIQWLPYLAVQGPVAIAEPTYSEHAVAWRQAGHDVVAMTSAGDLPAAAVHAVIVNPNNPDGRITDLNAIANMAAQVGQRGGWLVIDEAFADVDPAISAVALCPDLPIVILRSFGKFYGLAGLRLGFAVAAPAIIAQIAHALGPWACSGPALQIGTAALQDRAWTAQTIGFLARQAGALDAVLTQAGFEIVGGTSLFRLARHRGAKQIHAALAQRHIWCRSFDGADDLLRFGLPPDDAAMMRLAAALRDIA